MGAPITDMTDGKPLYPGLDKILNVIFVLILIMNVFAMVMTFMRRHIFPVSGRNPRGTLICAFFILILDVNYLLNLAIGARYPCVVHCMLYAIGVLGTVITFSARLWRLLFRYQLAKNMQKTLKRLQHKGRSAASISISTINPERGNWFYDNHSFGGHKLKLVVLADAIVIIFFMGLMLAFAPKMHKPGVCLTANVKPFTWTQGFFAFAHAVFCLCVAYYYRSFKDDACRLKAEIRWTGTVGVVCLLVSHFVHNSTPRGTYDLGVGYFTGALVSFVFIINTSILPVYWSYKGGGNFHQTAAAGMKARTRHKHQRSKTLDTELSDVGTRQLPQTLAECLALDDGRQLFLEFLQGEFSGENLLFWLEMQQFKEWVAHVFAAHVKRDKDGEVEEIKGELQYETVVAHTAFNGRCEKIYKRYVSEEAVYQVNISAKNRKQIANDLPWLSAEATHLEFSKGGASPNVFDKACEEVFKLMERDSWPRFKKSAAYNFIGTGVDLCPDENEKSVVSQGGGSKQSRQNLQIEDNDPDTHAAFQGALHLRGKSEVMSGLSPRSRDLDDEFKELDRQQQEAENKQEGGGKTKTTTGKPKVFGFDIRHHSPSHSHDDPDPNPDQDQDHDDLNNHHLRSPIDDHDHDSGSGGDGSKQGTADGSTVNSPRGVHHNYHSSNDAKDLTGFPPATPSTVNGFFGSSAPNSPTSNRIGDRSELFTSPRSDSSEDNKAQSNSSNAHVNVNVDVDVGVDGNKPSGGVLVEQSAATSAGGGSGVAKREPTNEAEEKGEE